MFQTVQVVQTVLQGRFDGSHKGLPGVGPAHGQQSAQARHSASGAALFQAGDIAVQYVGVPRTTAALRRKGSDRLDVYRICGVL